MFIARTDAVAETPILRSPVRRADSLEKTLMLEKIEGRRRRGQENIHSKTEIEDEYERVFHKHNQNIQINIIMEDRETKPGRKYKQVIVRTK